MKRAWLDLDSVPMPPRVAAMRRDERGYPIPHAVMWSADGKPDFRTIDPEKWAHAASSRQCGICGGSLGRHIAFVGGPVSIENRLFSDLPMHRDCAIYALQVCPFIAAPKFSFHQDTEGKSVMEFASDQRPDRFGLGMTNQFKLVKMPSGHVIMQAAPFVSIEWWRHGQLLTEEALPESL